MFFPIGGYGRDEFVRDYWRQRPLVVRGVQEPWQLAVNVHTVRAAMQRIETVRPSAIRRRKDGATFGQNLDAVSPDLRRISWQVGRELTCPNVWCDVLATEVASGIGCHYDNSDNFNIQLEGTKVWRLYDPSIIPLDLRRRSMMRIPEAYGGVDMPADAHEVVLEPGDLLYIPLFWLHEGVSQGLSLSATITCNTETGLGLLPYLRWVLSDEADWWGPMPLERVNIVSADAEGKVGQGLDDYFDNLFDKLCSPEVREKVKSAWLATRCEHLFGDGNENFEIQRTT